MPWDTIKVFAPYVIGALILAGLVTLVVDRNHLAALNDQHVACLASVQQASGAKPLATACDAPIGVAVERGFAAKACDDALNTGDTFAASQACSGPTKTLIADRNSKASEVANLTTQLAGADAAQADAVNRATARATANAQGVTRAQAVLAAAPRDAGGLSVCDADCLRRLTQAAPAGVPGGQ